MEIQRTIKISKDFSDKPGARYTQDSKNSGERFLNDILKPELEKAIKNQYKIIIDLDDVYGYPSSFVSGSFGKLSLDIGSDKMLQHVEFKSEQNPLRIEIIKNEIINPTKNDIK